VTTARKWLAACAFIVAIQLSACRRGAESSNTSVEASGAYSSLKRFQRRLKVGQMSGWNLVLITVDTLRADRLGCHGYEKAETPRIDGLAGRGAFFAHAVTPAPSTLPSHCTMMTGLDPPNHSVRSNGYFALPEKVETLAEILKHKGYATASITGTFVLNDRYGLNQGFDLYDDIEPDRPLEERNRPAAFITDTAIDWIRKTRQSDTRLPLFLWAHYFDPHMPYDPPAAYASRFAESLYDGEIAYTDEHVGRLLDFLESEGLTSRTLIVLTSDHGEGLGEHGEDTHSRLIYDSTMRVPLIFSSPQFHGHACRVDDITVGLIDIMPTVLSLLGIQAKGSGRPDNVVRRFDGLDLVTADVPKDRSIYIETLAGLMYSGWAPLHGVRRLNAKYIDAPTAEYYRLDRDPGELVNLLDRDPAIVLAEATEAAAQLNERLAGFPSLEETRALTRTVSSIERNRLAALGYVGDSHQADDHPDWAIDPKDMVPILNEVYRRQPEELLGEAWEVVRSAGRVPADYRRAEIFAKTACEKKPDDSAAAITLGAAHYRAGNHAASIKALSTIRAGDVGNFNEGVEIDQNSSPLDASLRMRAIAFRALALARLGRSDHAEIEWDRLRELASAAESEGVDAATRALVAEVESSIGKPGADKAGP